MINLHEVLSEFSYGYGITREIDALFSGIGLCLTPFFPNLRDEARLGYDVGFDRPGRALMLQFKLGQELRRFVRLNQTDSIPDLMRPFWRVTIRTSERQHQTLRAWESAGAEVYYVAPKFSNWRHYEEFMLDGEVLEHSLTFTPSELDRASGQPINRRRVVYDNNRHYICTEPVEFEEIDWPTRIHQIAELIRDPRAPSLADQISGLTRIEELFQNFMRLSVSQGINFEKESQIDPYSVILGIQAASLGTILCFVTENE